MVFVTIRYCVSAKTGFVFFNELKEPWGVSLCVVKLDDKLT